MLINDVKKNKMNVSGFFGCAKETKQFLLKLFKIKKSIQHYSTVLMVT